MSTSGRRSAGEYIERVVKRVNDLDAGRRRDHPATLVDGSVDAKSTSRRSAR